MCGQANCVNAQLVRDSAGPYVEVTSTIPDNKGVVLFTTDEWDTFLTEVKAGKWDHTASTAPATPALSAI